MSVALLLLAVQRIWSPDERVHLTDLSQVVAVAASPYRVYAATTGGLTLYDRRFQRWEPPVTVLDGYPAPPRRVLVALADPGEESVWLGLSDGWARYSPDTRRWEGGLTGAPVMSIMFDRDDPVSGIYLYVGGQWSFLPRGGAVPLTGRAPPPPIGDRRMLPLDVGAALRQAPVADAARPLLLTDASLRSYRFTSAARSADREELFFGTDGMGLVRVDGLSTEFQRLQFGLAGAAVQAMVAGAEGLWLAHPGRGITYLRADLSETRVVEATVASRLGFAAARDMVVAGGAIWIATDRGLLRWREREAPAEVFGVREGLPDDDVWAVAPAPDGVWAGTRRGLGHVNPAGVVTRVVTGPAILSLLAMGDTLWVGTQTGPAVLLPGSTTLTAPAGLDQAPFLRAPVVALARSGRRVVLATATHLGWRDSAGVWQVQRAPAVVGRVERMAGDSGGMWIAGASAVAFWRIGGGEATTPPLRAGLDLPVGIRDLVADRSYLWVATDNGVVRFARQAALGR